MLLRGSSTWRMTVTLICNSKFSSTYVWVVLWVTLLWEDNKRRTLLTYGPDTRGCVDEKANVMMDRYRVEKGRRLSLWCAMRWNPLFQDSHRVDLSRAAWSKIVQKECKCLGNSWDTLPVTEVVWMTIYAPSAFVHSVLSLQFTGLFASDWFFLAYLFWLILVCLLWRTFTPDRRSISRA